MSKAAFDKKIEALKAMRSAAELRKALKDRNNFLVSRAAEQTAALKLEELTPDLVAAFDRFMLDAAKSDPQCWAKNAIAKALKNLGHRDAGVFVRGIVHVQMEPVWGGQADSAATLRGTCALALVDCHLEDLAILTHLTDRLADPQTPVRMDAALAIAQFGRPEGVLPLRLKAALGDEDVAVSGQCFASLLALPPRESIAFVGSFLSGADEDVCTEAVSALAQSRQPEAFEMLVEFYRKKPPLELRRAVLISLGASPLREAADFLLAALRIEPEPLAASALTGLAASRFRSEVKDAARESAAARQELSLLETFQREFQF